MVPRIWDPPTATVEEGWAASPPPAAVWRQIHTPHTDLHIRPPRLEDDDRRSQLPFLRADEEDDDLHMLLRTLHNRHPPRSRRPPAEQPARCASSRVLGRRRACAQASSPALSCPCCWPPAATPHLAVAAPGIPSPPRALE
uniref:Uncharacterized protein n=1 Tax=Arundo donax TaxID=35708 RepID=A0A0A9GSS6_ARUDO